MWDNFAHGMEDCYVWIDYCCLDQDHSPAQEFQLQCERIVNACDVILTPIYDPHTVWEDPSYLYSYTDYKAKPFIQGNNAYINRGWCRLETFYFSNVEIPKSSRRYKNFDGAVHFHLTHGRRPHLVYGTKESRTNALPMVLPPLQNTYFQTYHPDDGNFGRAEDKAIVEKMTQHLMNNVRVVKEGYAGDELNGRRHGYGVFYYHNGNQYEGFPHISN